MYMHTTPKPNRDTTHKAHYLQHQVYLHIKRARRASKKQICQQQMEAQLLGLT